MPAPTRIAWAGISACPLGKDSYFWGVLAGLVAPVVFLLLTCFEVFLAFFAGVVLFWSGVDWPAVAEIETAQKRAVERAVLLGTCRAPGATTRIAERIERISGCPTIQVYRADLRQ